MENLPAAQKTPNDMISAALAGGADLDKLQKLLEMQMIWEGNEARKAFNKAMAAFKALPIKIEKDKTVKYNQTKYQHATLGNIVEKISEGLSQNGLSVSWRTHQNGKIVVACRISHEQGHFEETSLSADADTSGSKNSIQAIGSTITYLQRYSLLSLLGLATDNVDDDGRGAVEELLDDNKKKIIEDLIISSKAPRDQFLKYMGVDAVENIPASQFAKAKMALMERAKK
jgi:hypothetical protein